MGKGKRSKKAGKVAKTDPRGEGGRERKGKKGRGEGKGGGSDPTRIAAEGGGAPPWPADLPVTAADRAAMAAALAALPPVGRPIDPDAPDSPFRLARARAAEPVEEPVVEPVEEPVVEPAGYGELIPQRVVDPATLPQLSEGDEGGEELEYRSGGLEEQGDPVFLGVTVPPVPMGEGEPEGPEGGCFALPPGWPEAEGWESEEEPLTPEAVAALPSLLDLEETGEEELLELTEPETGRFLTAAEALAMLGEPAPPPLPARPARRPEAGVGRDERQLLGRLWRDSGLAEEE